MLGAADGYIDVRRRVVFRIPFLRKLSQWISLGLPCASAWYFSRTRGGGDRQDIYIWVLDTMEVQVPVFMWVYAACLIMIPDCTEVNNLDAVDMDICDAYPVRSLHTNQLENSDREVENAKDFFSPVLYNSSGIHGVAIASQGLGGTHTVLQETFYP